MKYVFILSLLLVISNFGCSQSSEKSEKKEQTPLPALEEGTNNSLLWMVTKDDSQDTSFVFGTMHIIQKEYFFFPDVLKDVISASDLVVLEIGEEMNNPFKAMNLLKLEEGKSMFDFFNEAQTDSLLAWAQNEMGYSEETFRTMFGKMKPFVIVSAASAGDMLKNSESYERTIMKIQKEKEIKLEGLETLEEQMSIFDDLTDEEQAKMVMEAIKGGDEANKELQEMIRLYTTQNIDSMYQMIHNDSDAIANKESEFLDDRNTKWIPKMEKMMLDKRVFFAVGAAHLGGDIGVLELLRKEGFHVTPVKL
jgi:uncharacterized protein YbaP (TraB family)